MRASLPALTSMIVFAVTMFWTIGHRDTSATALGFALIYTIVAGGTVVGAMIVAQIATSKVDHLDARLIAFTAITVMLLAIALMVSSLRDPHPDPVGNLKLLLPMVRFPTIASWAAYALVLWRQDPRA